jgi:hypothetical protein
VCKGFDANDGAVPNIFPLSGSEKKHLRVPFSTFAGNSFCEVKKQVFLVGFVCCNGHAAERAFCVLRRWTAYGGRLTVDGLRLTVDVGRWTGLLIR